MVGLLSTHHARPTHEISDDASQPRRAALGAAERVARDCDPLREDRLQLHGRPLPRRHPRLAQALTGPSFPQVCASASAIAARAIVFSISVSTASARFGYLSVSVPIS